MRKCTSTVKAFPINIARITEEVIHFVITRDNLESEVLSLDVTLGVQ